MATFRYFATCARGLEPVLAKELEHLKASEVQTGRGGVAFAGDRELLFQANLWLRTAVRVLQPILEVSIQSPEELYDRVQDIDWQRYLTLEHTFAVDCNVRDSAITHSHYAALKTKDAICDQFVARLGRRPSIDVQNPMVKLNLHIYRDEMVLSLDSSGESLHKRGYRPIQTKAPLNEALAAGLVLLTGWDSTTPFADPMCGSGTLPIEASWIALNRPPGLTRKHFGFQGWLDFDIKLWTAIRDEARHAVRKELPAPIVGSDVRRDAITFAGRNARAAGVGHLLHFEVKDLRDFVPPPVSRRREPSGEPGRVSARGEPGCVSARSTGVLLCNPPYGERIGEIKELKSLYRLLGDTLRERCEGYTAFVFSGNPDLEDEIGLKATAGIPLYNGRIPCRLLRYEIG